MNQRSTITVSKEFCELLSLVTKLTRKKNIQCLLEDSLQDKIDDWKNSIDEIKKLI